jgi:hypothetical protein
MSRKTDSFQIASSPASRTTQVSRLRRNGCFRQDDSSIIDPSRERKGWRAMRGIHWLLWLVVLAALAGCGNGDDDDDGRRADDDNDDTSPGADDDDDDNDDDNDDTVPFGEVTGFVEIPLAEDLVCRDTYCYLAARETGVAVVDVSERDAPAWVATYDTPVKVWNVLLGEDDTLYVADDEGGVIKLDITDPTAPAELWTYTSTYVVAVIDLALGDYLYLAGAAGSDGRFEIYEETKEGPTPKGVWQANGEPLTAVGCVGTTCYAGGEAGHLWRLDCEEPTAPSVWAPYYNEGTPGHEPWGLGVTLYNYVVYFSDWAAGLAALDAELAELYFLSSSDGIYDSAPAGALTIAGTPYDEVLVAANSQGGLWLLDIHDPAAVALIGDPLDVTPPGEIVDGPSGVAVLGTYAYLADKVAEGLTIVKIAD